MKTKLVEHLIEAESQVRVLVFTVGSAHKYKVYAPNDNNFEKYLVRVRQNADGSAGPNTIKNSIPVTWSIVLMPSSKATKLISDHEFIWGD